MDDSRQAHDLSSEDDDAEFHEAAQEAADDDSVSQLASAEALGTQDEKIAHDGEEEAQSPRQEQARANARAREGASDSAEDAVVIVAPGGASMSVEPPSLDGPFPVKVNFDAANAPILKKRTLTFKSNAQVHDVIQLLQSKLKLDTLVLVVEKCFTPTLDQDLGTLYKSFARNDALYITYSPQPVFG